MMKGNEAIAEAAVRAGARFYAGYPITPSSEIMEYLSWRMEEVGGAFVQAESELAGINMVIGAAACGVRALTASSGPGISLKQEGISTLCDEGLSAVVITQVRYGNGLGTLFTSQCDYNRETRGGGQGDYRCIVLCPSSIQEYVDLILPAYELAEKYRIVVVMMGEGTLGQMMEPVTLPDFVETKRTPWALNGHYTYKKIGIFERASMKEAVELREKYKEQSGPVRRGVGMACFSYKTGVYPISLETASARLVLNQDGTVQLHLGATEIGQGGDTVFSQMAAQAIGIPTEDVHIVSFQDTDTAPFDTGAYASRQTYVTGKAIKKVGEEFREKLLAYAAELFPDASGLDIRERQVVDGAGEALISLADLAMNAFYSLEHSVHITAEDTNHCKENTFAFGCCFAEVEVDIPVGKVRVLRIVNVHDSGKLINPALAEAQVHGGMSMGIGYALTEEMKFDPKTGRLLNGNLLDYKMPTSMDHPELTALFVETDDPSGPFGNKALGEPPTIPVAPAIRNAVLQATGVAVNTLPLSPQKLVEEFTRGGLI